MLVDTGKVWRYQMGNQKRKPKKHRKCKGQEKKRRKNKQYSKKRYTQKRNTNLLNTWDELERSGGIAVLKLIPFKSVQMDECI